MRRTIRLSILAVAVSALLAIPAASAGAATTNPSSFNFGGQPVGSSSATQSTTLTTTCFDVVVTYRSLPTDTMNVNIATTGDFTATSNCPASLAPSLLGVPASCTVKVSFKPSSVGPHTGTLSTGTVGLLVPATGPAVALSGTGAASGSGTAGKKCNTKKSKKRSASAAKKKKCKKHKKKHRR